MTSCWMPLHMNDIRVVLLLLFHFQIIMKRDFVEFCFVVVILKKTDCFIVPFVMIVCEPSNVCDMELSFKNTLLSVNFKLVKDKSNFLTSI